MANCPPGRSPAPATLGPRGRLNRRGGRAPWPLHLTRVTADHQINAAKRSKAAPPWHGPGNPAPPETRLILAGPVIAGVTLVAALLATRSAGVPLRDPGDVAATRLGIAACMIVVLMVFDILIRAGRGSERALPSASEVRDAARERWNPYRLSAVAIALVSFYVTYLAYRNLKSVVPLIRPGDIFDGQLADIDRSLFAGNDPAELLHSVFGTGVAAHALSGIYMLFFLFIPVCLALALVLSADSRPGLFFTAALSLNWALGAASYFLLPSLGPIYADPGAFAALPDTQVSDLQASLIDHRAEFLGDPEAAGAAQSIGAFASLHVAIFFTVAAATQLLGLSRALKVSAWTLTGLTVLATIYFGWHYLLDDVGGVAIALASLALARVLTGIDLRAARRLRRVPAPAPEPA